MSISVTERGVSSVLVSHIKACITVSKGGAASMSLSHSKQGWLLFMTLSVKEA